MIAFDNIEDLNKIIRTMLITSSELNSDQVLNSLSIHGEDLDALFEEQVYVSIERSDALLLFELKSRNNESDMSQTEDDETISHYRSFEIYVILYGNASSDIATKIIARLRTAQYRQALRGQGIYLETVTESETLNEYKNETMWLRNDFSINISCRFELVNTMSDEEFETLNQITLTKI